VIRRSPVETVIGSVVTALRASTALTALATGGIYNNVPQGTDYPYVEVTSPTDRREDTYGRFGAALLVDVKAISQSQGDQEAARIQDQCVRALNFQPLATTTHTTLGITWESSDRFAEIVNGIRTRYHVGTFRVWTEQTS